MSSNRGKSTMGFSGYNNQKESAASDANLSPAQDEGWEVYGKKGKGKVGGGSTKQAGPQHPSNKAWGQPDTVQRLGMRNSGGSGRGSGQPWQTVPSKNGGRGYAKQQSSNKTSESAYNAVPPTITAPLKNGWGWNNRPGASQPSQEVNPADDQSKVDIDDYDEELDDIEDTDDELLSDGFDSDESEKSHESRKQNDRFKEFFQLLDKMTIEQINEPERQWHCPACKGGPGAIDWYRLQPLITHAKTKRSKRVKLHRELAELLDEELRRRGTSAVPAGEMFGQWRGLEERDKEIVWPPMVIIMNTRLEKGDNEKWIGMGNQELPDYFSSFSAIRARHSYGPQGHRGISVLIFESSAVGYAEAERLSKHFEDIGRDRQAWDRYRVPFYAGGKRQLYGYMAESHDMESFNQHCQGKTKLKYEMKSYQEMVVKQMKQMSEDNQQLIWFKNKVAKEQKNKKALEESFNFMSEKLRQTSEENRIVKLRSKEQHEQNQKEMDYQDQFYRERMQMVYDARDVKEENLEKVMQNERDKVVTTQSSQPNLSVEERLRNAEVEKFIQLQEKEAEEYASKRDSLMNTHKERLLELKKRHWEEEMALEQEFDRELDKLFAEYNPSSSSSGPNVEKEISNLKLDGK